MIIKHLNEFAQQSSIYPCFHSSSSLIFYHFHVLCNSHFQLIIKVMITIAILKCEKHASHNWNLRVESCHKLHFSHSISSSVNACRKRENITKYKQKKKFKRRALGAYWLKDEWFDLFPSLNKDFHLLLLLLLILLLLARSLFNRSADVAATVVVSRWSCELEVTSRKEKQI